MFNYKYFSILLLILLFSCQDDNRDDKLQTKEIEIKEVQENLSPVVTDEEKTKSIDTFLDIETLFPGMTAVEKSESNLDHDTAIEQFIILVDELNQVKLVVADFNKITREYFPAWEIQLPIIYNSDFLMTEQDVLGYKHNQELVVSGTTINNKNALYIFVKSAPPKGIYIYYKTIFSNESAGTVELVTKTRSLDYTENRKDSDKAYDVAVEKSNFINENTVAVIKENWAFNKSRNVFVKISSETTEQKINEEDSLSKLYSGSKKDFINFLNGEWYLKGETADDDRILIFNSTNESVTLKYGDGVEIYRIKRSYKGYKKITLYLINSDISTIPFNIYVSLKSNDILTISYKTSTAWDGDYTRLNNEVKRGLITDTNTDIKKDIPFTGIFKNVLYSINFYYPEYSKFNSEDGTIEEGEFRLLQLDNDSLVLQLKANSDLRSKYNITNHLLTYSENKLESQVIRTIKIHEGVLTTHGIETKPDKNPMRFEQTEVISEE